MTAGRWWLRLFVGLDADALAGDLSEEAAAMRAAGVPAWRTKLWRAGQVFLACSHGLFGRVRQLRPSMVSIRRGAVDAVRAVARRPANSLAIIVTLALGLGANIAVFTVLNAALWRPLPYPNDERLVVVREQRNDKPDSRGVSYLNFSDWRTTATSFESMALVSATSGSFDDGRVVTRAEGAVVSPGFFRVLGVGASLGVTLDAFTDTARTADGAPPLMLSDSGWRKHFAADPAVIGRRVKLDGETWQIIGVTPPGIIPRVDEPVDFWVTPAAFGNPLDSSSANGSRNFRQYAAVVARLKDDATLQSAQAEVGAIEARLASIYPKAFVARSVTVEPLRGVLLGDSARTLWALFAMVTVVLLIACVNVAHLWLARAAARRREIATRFALGAKPIDVLVQMSFESLLISAVGGVVSFLLARGLIAALMAALPAGVPRIVGLSPDWRVGLFGFGLVVLISLLCGVWPAIAATRGDRSAGGLASVRGATRGATSSRLRGALISIEVAAAFVLVVAAGLLTNSLIRLTRVEPGFDASHVLTSRVAFDDPRYENSSIHPVRLNQALDDIQRRVAALPGVTGVAFAQSVPLSGTGNSTSISFPGQTAPEGVSPTTDLRFVSGNYFDVMRIPLTNGREFSGGDTDRANPVVIVNQTFVQEFLGDRNPLGATIELGWGGDAPKTIVGVVGDVRHRDLGERARPEVYVPQSQFGNTNVTVVVRSSSTNESTGPSIGAAIRAVDPSLAVEGVKTLDAYRRETLATPNFAAQLVGIFGVLSLVLAAVGLHGVTSYATSQRTQEIGLRMALGARAPDVIRLVVAQGAKPVAAGLLVGFLLSMLSSRALGAWLYEVRPADPLTFVAGAIVLLATGAAACYGPARRAARVDPLLALRRD